MGERYTRTSNEAPLLESSIIHDLAAELRPRQGGETRLGKAGTTDVEAYRLYLKGRSTMKKHLISGDCSPIRRPEIVPSFHFHFAPASRVAPQHRGQQPQVRQRAERSGFRWPEIPKTNSHPRWDYMDTRVGISVVGNQLASCLHNQRKRELLSREQSEAGPGTSPLLRHGPAWVHVVLSGDLRLSLFLQSYRLKLGNAITGEEAQEMCSLYSWLTAFLIRGIQRQICLLGTYASAPTEGTLHSLRRVHAATRLLDRNSRIVRSHRSICADEACSASVSQSFSTTAGVNLRTTLMATNKTAKSSICPMTGIKVGMS
jgi:hypothetical protein